jgi:hypothetical protein
VGTKEITEVITAAVAVAGLVGGVTTWWFKRRAAARKAATEALAKLIVEKGQYSHRAGIGLNTAGQPGQYSVFIKNLGPAMALQISATLRDINEHEVFKAKQTIASLEPKTMHRVEFVIPQDAETRSVDLWLSYTDDAGPHTGKVASDIALN